MDLTPSATAASASAATEQLDDFPSTRIGSYLSANYNLEVEMKKVPGFICGQCNCLNTLKARESIRCRECGYRIMYKERMRRPMEYSAQ